MSKLLNRLIDSRTVLAVILLNSFVLFLDAFGTIHKQYDFLLFGIDYICTIYFIFEIVTKRMLWGRKFWADGWNVFDFIIVVLSTPVLLAPFIASEHFAFIIVFRLARLIRYLRLLYFIPDHQHMARGLGRALRASVGVFLVVILVNFIFSLGAVYLFRDICPKHFDNPGMAIYTIFRVFTVEGWYEVPELIAQHSTPFMGILARAYFVFTVFTGGIIGLSLANAVFVDQMTSDNMEGTDRLILDTQKKIVDLQKQVLDNQEEMRRKLAELKKQIK